MCYETYVFSGSINANDGKKQDELGGGASARACATSRNESETDIKVILNW